MAVKNLGLRFGGLDALSNVSFEITAGQILGLIGPNGAGKTSLFNCLSRVYTPTSGDITLDNESILDKPVHRMAKLGLGRTFQNLALFPQMTVFENVCVGFHSRTTGDFVSDSLGLPWASRRERAIERDAWKLIDYIGLGAVAAQKAGDLPFGTQKRIELARALATKPRIILLDEPACGLNHDEVGELGKLIVQIKRDHDVTILLVEHHMNLVMSISDHIVVLNFGRKIAEGTPKEIQANPEVISAYLGGQQ